jgi:hypothetical protein
MEVPTGVNEIDRVDFRDEFYSRLKGPSTGYCRICGNRADLSDDHIPPKAIFNDRPFEVTSFPHLGYSQTAKAGLKVRSLCPKCNNEVLGSTYDPELIKFSREVAYNNFIRNGLHLASGRFEYKVRTRRLAKAILGHLLALYEPLKNVGEKVDMTSVDYLGDLRRFIISNDNKIVNDIHLYSWLHPFESTFVVPFFTMINDFSIKEYISGSIFKFFPLGFWVVLAKDLTEYKINLPKIPVAADDGEICSFVLDHRITTSERFPIEPPPDRGALLINRESCYYAQRRPDGRLVLSVDRPS